MERYRIEAGEETEETKVLNVTLEGDPFAVATYFKGQRTSTIRIDPNVNRKDIEIDHEFIKKKYCFKCIMKTTELGNEKFLGLY